jgi:hypothetical protein
VERVPPLIKQAAAEAVPQQLCLILKDFFWSLEVGAAAAEPIAAKRSMAAEAVAA